LNPLLLIVLLLYSTIVGKHGKIEKLIFQKAKEEKGEESRNKALKVAGAVGLLALLIGTGGGFGP
jgi:uncharacterized membrane protein YfcA